MWVLVQYVEDFEKYIKDDLDIGEDSYIREIISKFKNEVINSAESVSEIPIINP